MKIAKKLLFCIVAAALLTGALTACHTVSGVGQDVQATGQAVSYSAHAASY